MIISSLWITRKGPEDTPELLAAWDEYSIEENWSGWVAACEQAMTGVGDDAAEKRFVNISVDDAALRRLFGDWTLTSKISEGEDPTNK